MARNWRSTDTHSGLPPAPTGFLWEITVERQEETGHRFLKLKLLGISPNEAVAQTSCNLDWYALFRCSWATHYRRYPRLSEEEGRSQIVLPMIDWAMTEAAKRTPGSECDYHEVIA